MSSHVTQWGRDVKKAKIDREYTNIRLAKEAGVCLTTLSNLINGRYAKEDYIEIAKKVNAILGITGLPEKPPTPSDTWCKTVRKAMIDHDMRSVDLAIATGYSKDKISMVLNGHYLDEPVVDAINLQLNIDIPVVDS
ncbi:MAG: hypothetical protein NC293_08700 [Roseburia sp.]|nr:hypothetical protein [Roseburia sp.]